MSEMPEARASLIKDITRVDQAIAHHQEELARQWALRADLTRRLGEAGGWKVPTPPTVPQQSVQPSADPRPRLAEQQEVTFGWFAPQAVSLSHTAAPPGITAPGIES